MNDEEKLETIKNIYVNRIFNRLKFIKKYGFTTKQIEHDFSLEDINLIKRQCYCSLNCAVNLLAKHKNVIDSISSYMSAKHQYEMYLDFQPSLENIMDSLENDKFVEVKVFKIKGWTPIFFNFVYKTETSYKHLEMKYEYHIQMRERRLVVVNLLELTEQQYNEIETDTNDTLYFNKKQLTPTLEYKLSLFSEKIAKITDKNSIKYFLDLLELENLYDYITSTKKKNDTNFLDKMKCNFNDCYGEVEWVVNSEFKTLSFQTLYEKIVTNDVKSLYIIKSEKSSDDYVNCEFLLEIETEKEPVFIYVEYFYEDIECGPQNNRYYFDEYESVNDFLSNANYGWVYRVENEFTKQHFPGLEQYNECWSTLLLLG